MLSPDLRISEFNLGIINKVFTIQRRKHLFIKIVTTPQFRIVHIIALELNSVEARVVVVGLGDEARDDGVGWTVGPAHEAAPVTVELDTRSDQASVTILRRNSSSHLHLLRPHRELDGGGRPGVPGLAPHVGGGESSRCPVPFGPLAVRSLRRGELPPVGALQTDPIESRVVVERSLVVLRLDLDGEGVVTRWTPAPGAPGAPVLGPGRLDDRHVLRDEMIYRPDLT